jgi:hypothetical protein
MNSRRFISFPEAQDRHRSGSSQDWERGTATGRSMSALGHKQTIALQNVMSALPPKADMCSATAHVCFGPKADIASSYRAAMSGSFHVLSNNGFSPLGVRVWFFEF